MALPHVSSFWSRSLLVLSLFSLPVTGMGDEDEPELTPLFIFPSVGPDAVFSADGKMLATASIGDDGAVKVWDVTTGREYKELKRSPMAIAFSPDGKLLAVTALDLEAEDRFFGVVVLWELATGKKRMGLTKGAGVISFDCVRS